LLDGGGASDLSFHFPYRGFGACADTLAAVRANATMAHTLFISSSRCVRILT
jgi:hypothetical protein